MQTTITIPETLTKQLNMLARKQSKPVESIAISILQAYFEDNDRLEDECLAKAIDEGMKSKLLNRAEALALLEA